MVIKGSNKHLLVCCSGNFWSLTNNFLVIINYKFNKFSLRTLFMIFYVTLMKGITLQSVQYLRQLFWLNWISKTDCILWTAICTKVLCTIKFLTIKNLESIRKGSHCIPFYIKNLIAKKFSKLFNGLQKEPLKVFPFI